MAATITVIQPGCVEEKVRFISDCTCAEAKKEIRSSFVLERGRLEDVETGISLRDDDKLGEDRQFKFVGGRSLGNYLSFNHSCQF